MHGWPGRVAVARARARIPCLIVISGMRCKICLGKLRTMISYVRFGVGNFAMKLEHRAFCLAGAI